MIYLKPKVEKIGEEEYGIMIQLGYGLQDKDIQLMDHLLVLIWEVVFNQIFLELQKKLYLLINNYIN